MKRPNERLPGEGGLMIILRGLSGAGKTTYWRHNHPTAKVCSTEDYFDRSKPLEVSAFRPAAANCMLDAIEACQDGAPVIVIDNTLSTAAEVGAYVQLAEAYRYQWSVITVEAHPRDALKRNVHGTPAVAQDRIAARMRGFMVAVPVWWKFQGTIRSVRPTYSKEQLAALSDNAFDSGQYTPKANPDAPECHYCGKLCTYSPTSSHIYSGRDYGPVWECEPCDARCGVHKVGTPPFRKPLGTPSNEADRELRKEAHAVFDALWERKMAKDGLKKRDARSRAYIWLAEELDIPADDCHIGMMHGEQLEQVIAICTPPYGAKKVG